MGNYKSSMSDQEKAKRIAELNGDIRWTLVDLKMKEDFLRKYSDDPYDWRYKDVQEQAFKLQAELTRLYSELKTFDQNN